MAFRSIAQLKAWFKRGKYPTETQFSDWMDSYWHKEEKIPVISVDQLPEQLNEKYPKADGVQLAERTTKVEQELTQHEQYADEKFGTIYDRLEELDELKIDKAVIGKPDGVAALDGEGKVPADQLPSYVDDVLEGTLSDAVTFLDPNGAAYSPETGKIYVDTTSNREYRWAGAQYEILSKSLELGESSSTAFRGDYGRVAYDHSLVTDGGNPHGTTFASLPDKSGVWTSANFDPASRFGLNSKKWVSDLNTAPINSFWASSQKADNCPAASLGLSSYYANGFTVTVDNNPRFLQQWCFCADHTWFRRMNDGSWGGWIQIWDSENLTDATPTTTGLMTAADKTKLDSMGSSALLTTTLNDDDRVMITQAETGQQAAAMKAADFKKWAFKTLPYVGENMARNSNDGRIYNVIYDIQDEDIGKTLTFTMNVLHTGSPFTFYLFNVVDGNFVWGALNLSIQIIPDPAYKTYSLTFQVPEGIRNQNRAIRTGGNANFSSVKWYKLEPGIFPTTWSPAPGEIARAMDYSLLSEQIVPGEFWVGVDGIKRQVYVQSFIGTIDQDKLITHIRDGVRAAQILYGYVALDENSTKDPFPFTIDMDYPGFGKGQKIYNTQASGALFLLHTMVPETFKFVATFKFTKL